LSVNKPSRREHLDSLKNETRTMLFYEAPHKLGATLKDMYSAFGEREIAIVREITKIHEQVIRTTLSAAVEAYGEGGLKGEIVLVIHGAELIKEEEKLTLDDAVRLAEKSVENGVSISEAAKQAAKVSGYKKGEIYKRLIGV
ncbi:MAG: 16S rRNA (cytidine(1402)-2'-O)-methyltransferase, partial [Acutalibacteraceae bacterium]|nr:16S rRNA (cytidine(1402)-2'-O)-methyltransferase [Acutalibacteraceae bacterium]